MLPRSRSRANRRMKKSSRGSGIRVLSRAAPTVPDTCQDPSCAGDRRAMPIDVTTTQDAGAGHLPTMAFNELALRERLTNIRRVGFPTTHGALPDLEALGEVLIDDRSGDGATALVRSEDELLILLAMSRGFSVVAVAGADGIAVQRLSADLARRLRDPERHDDETVPITFWAGGGRGPLTPRRRIAAPAWSDVAGNYASGTCAALRELMVASEPGPGGLVLWHGAPGTGKSYALRSLAREWWGWCDTCVIADPETFLGARSAELLSTLLRT